MLQEIHGVSHDLQAREALPEVGSPLEQIPELVEGGLDLLVTAFQERVDRPTDVILDFRRNLGDCEAGGRALLEPLGCLTVRLAPAPGVEVGRHGV